MIKLFFGLAVDDAIAQRLVERAIQHNPKLNKIARWVKPDHFHLTVRFIGNYLEAEVPDLIAAVINNIQGAQSFNLTVSSIDQFPLRRPRMIVAHFLLNSEMAKLYHAVDSVVVKLGTPEEKRPFAPHMTLCRFKYYTKIKFTPIYLEHFKIPTSQLILYQSKPTDKGTQYLAVHRFDLVG